MRSAAEHLPRSGLCGVERSEQAGVEAADGAVSEADGAGGGQHAPRPGKTKSRRWRDGDSRSGKASGAAAAGQEVRR